MTAQYNTGPGPLTDLQKVVDDLHLVQADVTDERAIADLFMRGATFFGQEVQVLVGEFFYFDLLARGIRIQGFDQLTMGSLLLTT